MKWSDLPGRHSLFWKLAFLLVAFCLLMIWLSWSWGRYMEERNQFLSDDARGTLSRYAAEAEQAWTQGGRAGVDSFLQSMQQRESGWVGVISGDLQSLSSQEISDKDVQHLTWQAYMNKRLVRAKPGAHLRIFLKDTAHLLGLAKVAA